ncbi:hypothetical protein [Flavobacterium humi]|nr:hypothetical protein [Flavobacterium humi]
MNNYINEIFNYISEISNYISAIDNYIMKNRLHQQNSFLLSG